MNVPLLRRIQEVIREVPARYMMEDFIYRFDPGMELDLDNVVRKAPACGTVGCFSGWARILTVNPTLDPEGPWPDSSEANTRTGVEDLDLPYPHPWLFVVSDWPDELRHRFFDAKTVEEKAAVGIEAIDYYIKYDGKFAPGDLGEF